MATFNRAKVANATGTATAGTLTLGATSPGYSDLSKYNTRKDVPYLITWDGGYELGIGTVSLTASTYYLARTMVLENSSGTYVALQVPAQAEIAVTNLFHTAVAIGSSGSRPSPPKASGSGALAIGPGCTASAQAFSAYRPGAGTSAGVGAASSASVYRAAKGASTGQGGARAISRQQATGAALGGAEARAMSVAAGAASAAGRGKRKHSRLTAVRTAPQTALPTLVLAATSELPASRRNCPLCLSTPKHQTAL